MHPPRSPARRRNDGNVAESADMPCGRMKDNVAELLYTATKTNVAGTGKYSRRILLGRYLTRPDGSTLLYLSRGATRAVGNRVRTSSLLTKITAWLALSVCLYVQRARPDRAMDDETVSRWPHSSAVPTSRNSDCTRTDHRPTDVHCRYGGPTVSYRRRHRVSTMQQQRAAAPPPRLDIAAAADAADANAAFPISVRRSIRRGLIPNRNRCPTDRLPGPRVCQARKLQSQRNSRSVQLTDASAYRPLSAYRR